MALRSSTERVTLLDIETVYATAATMSEADAILLMDTQVTPTADKLERTIDQPFYGADPFVLVGKRVTLTGMCDLIGSATPGTAAPLGKLYRTLGHSETLVPVGPPIETVYAPISKNFESATIDFFWAGIKCRLTGARGSLDMQFDIKTFAKGTVNITGIFSIPTDEEPPTGIDWTVFQTPAAIETETWEVIVDGVNVCAQSLAVQANATINLIECSEAREVAYTDRKPTGTLRVYKDSPLATWNPWSVADAQSVIVLENTITKASGLNVAIPMRAQLEYPKPVDIDGVAGFEIPFSLVPSGAGGDEYEIHVS